MSTFMLVLQLMTGNVFVPPPAEMTIRYKNEPSKKAHNEWDRLSFSVDEGNNDKMPFVLDKGEL